MGIKSVNIRVKGINRRLLMPSSKVGIFESFLLENIGNEVIVVNTNIGMEVYYYSEENYSDFIKETILLYTINRVDTNKLIFRNNLSWEEVYHSFCEALMTFAQYPQLFLAYTKKFIRIKEQHESSRYIIPVLNGFFEEVLAFLSENGNMPHNDKITAARSKLQKTDPDKKILADLISEILSKKHSN